MNLTLKLLRTIGSPFCQKVDLYLPKTKEEALELYKLAVKNKIGLLYLESLNSRWALKDLALEQEYEDEIYRHGQQANTASRIAGVLNASNAKYAIFKSIMPFPATPNDVDIIHFGSDKEYERVVDSLLLSEYIEVKGDVDAEQRMFHDSKCGGNLAPHPPKKDIYDVDLYQKISASKTIYLDKNKLIEYIQDIHLLDNPIKILRPEAELVAILIHSIIPEMICTLFVYYAMLYHLSNMNSDNIKKFIFISRDNHVTYSVKVHCSLVAELHKYSYGFVPKQISQIKDMLDFETTRESAAIVKNNYSMPHKCDMFSVSKILLEKSNESTFRKSLIKQLIYMANISQARWIFRELILRRTRETY